MKISVVIPTLDEADHIEAAIEAVAQGSGKAPAGEEPASAGTCGAPEPGSGSRSGLRGGPDGGAAAPGPEASVEIVVVDGGSRDGTDRIAAAAGARLLRSEPGRARQLGVGARACGGEVVLFLHADTRLPPGWDAAVREALGDPGVLGGAFRFRFDDRSAALRWIEWGARLRGEWLRLPYGDQALFVRRAALEALGGVPQVPLMEDLDLVREMKRSGRLALLPLAATTSARRYRARGPLRTFLRHAAAVGAWSLGVPRGRIARWVRG